jgi:hypothetical protein
LGFFTGSIAPDGQICAGQYFSCPVYAPLFVLLPASAATTAAAGIPGSLRL